MCKNFFIFWRGVLKFVGIIGYDDLGFVLDDIKIKSIEVNIVKC